MRAFKNSSRVIVKLLYILTIYTYTIICKTKYQYLNTKYHI
nr:MAG TPA: hypothetical protein [Caudoviricetes sp.]DAT60894.1 MAG TPA: hypothetical protein [Caudoviricetes sp.]